MIVTISDIVFNNVTFLSPSCHLNSIYSSEICKNEVPILILSY